MNHQPSASPPLSHSAALSSPLASQLLLDRDPKVVAEAAHAIFDDPAITEAYPDLADLLRRDPRAMPPAIRRSIAANRYLADRNPLPVWQSFAADTTNDENLRLAALQALASWTKDSKLNPVDGRYDPLEPANAAFAKPAYLPDASAIEHSSENKVFTAVAAEVAKNLGIVANPEDLLKEVLDVTLDPTIRIRALDALENADPAAFEENLPKLLKDDSEEIRTHAATLLATKNPSAAIEYAKSALADSDDYRERQQSVLLLGKIEDPSAKTALQELATRAVKDPDSELTILLELSETVPTVSEALSSKSPLAGGDAELGETVFNENLSAQCTACHRVGDVGSDVGPPLTKIGEKGRAYILESLLAPQAKIAAGYGMMSVKTKAGESFAGALKEETPETLVLVMPDKSETSVKIEDIESRTEPMTTMPPMGAILNPRELRDLVEFLSEQK